MAQVTLSSRISPRVTVMSRGSASLSRLTVSTTSLPAGDAAHRDTVDREDPVTGAQPGALRRRSFERLDDEGLFIAHIDIRTDPLEPTAGLLTIECRCSRRQVRGMAAVAEARQHAVDRALGHARRIEGGRVDEMALGQAP
jgi:hypothetical protein